MTDDLLKQPLFYIGNSEHSSSRLAYPGYVVLNYTGLFDKKRSGICTPAIFDLFQLTHPNIRHFHMDFQHNHQCLFRIILLRIQEDIHINPQYMFLDHKQY